VLSVGQTGVVPLTLTVLSERQAGVSRVVVVIGVFVQADAASTVVEVNAVGHLGVVPPMVVVTVGEQTGVALLDTTVVE
jgi:hypothetical protein